MRVRQGARVRVAVSAAAQVVGGGETLDGKRREERAGRRGRAEPWGARARPLVAGGEYAHRGLTARPSPGKARAPAARACAARRPPERALSARARARNLRHPPAQAPAAAPPPPPPPTFCRRHRSHFLLCLPLLSSPSRLSGKCEAPKSASRSARLHLHTAAPLLRDGFHEVGIGRGQRRRPLLAPSTLQRWDWGDLEKGPMQGMHARVCVCPVCVCVWGVSTRPASRGPGRGCAHRVGRGWR